MEAKRRVRGPNREGHDTRQGRYPWVRGLATASDGVCLRGSDGSTEREGGRRAVSRRMDVQGAGGENGGMGGEPKQPPSGPDASSREKSD
jgi:hypothetical protein